MAIREFRNFDMEGEVVMETQERLRLGEAKNFAMEHNCTVMIRSWKGWTFKKGPSRQELGKEKPEGLIASNATDVYII